jgi:osmotically-inducible protein OsmY
MFTNAQVHADHTTRAASEACGACLAARVTDALRTASYVPEDDVEVEVRGHVVYLSGTVKWDHQRVAAERAVEHLDGVHVLKNCICVLPRVSASQTKEKIMGALRANNSDRGARIDVDVDGSSVTLTGVVGSYTDRLIAEHAAQSMSQVQSVTNELHIVKA